LEYCELSRELSERQYLGARSRSSALLLGYAQRNFFAHAF
jgi:hypothetical protein